MEYQEFADNLKKFSGVYLYGAGVVAYGVYKAIWELFGIVVKGLLVTNKDSQPEEIDGISVHVWKEIKIENDDLIVVATPEEYHEMIGQALQEWGIINHIMLDSHMEYVLMGRYLKKLCNLRLIEDYQTDGLGDCFSAGIYMAVSHMDRKLKGAYKEEPWVKKIQVGAVLTKQRIAELNDERCDSLSRQNALYGEMSAAYYAWKYGKYDVTGIFHYRRILKVTKEQMKLLENRQLDVVLPLPFVCYPDASGQYGRYLLKPDVEVMMQVLGEKNQKNFETYKKLLKMPYLYNYNMLIARREVFDDYCGWIFPLLQEITDRCEMEQRNRLPRYIGRIGEVLTSLYFMSNERKWKIAHAEKVWRV